MASDSRGGVVAAVLGTGAALLWCSGGVGPQLQQGEARGEPHREPDGQNADGQPQRDEYQPDDDSQPGHVRVQSVRDPAPRRRARLETSRSNEVMIMSSPRPMSDTYSDIGMRNSRETPGFIQKAQAAEAQRILQRFSMSVSQDSESQPVTFDETDPALAFAAAQRRLLPKRIILVRHGESEANADVSLLRHKPDNLIELTAKGSQQALAVGQRIKKVVGNEKVCLVVSPFERTLQTSRNLRLALDELQIVKTSVEPRLREQEFGNLQGGEFRNFRSEQAAVGRFWYRFPTGESGCDVHSRVAQWFDSVVPIFNMSGREHVDNLIVVTHGLTMRLILMHLGGWSPNTFHSVWNANNCDMYVLARDLSLVGLTPYAVAPESDKIRSSTFVHVRFRDSPGMAETVRKLVERLAANERPNAKPGTNELECYLQLNDYLALPQPRTRQDELAKAMLVEQHGIDADSIVMLDFHASRTGYHSEVAPPSKFR